MTQGKGGLHMVTYILLIIGGLNWLALALFDWEIGALFGGMGAVVSKIIYILVGLAAIYEAITHKGMCKACDTTTPMAQKPAGM